MKDRTPLYPGRVSLTPVIGQNNIFDMVRADEPEQEGTPLNKATFLKDATAALFGLDANAVPDDVLQAIKTALDNQDAAIAAGAKIATGSYTGTGKYGSANPNSLTFDFTPKALLFPGCSGNGGSIYVYGNAIWVAGGGSRQTCLYVSGSQDLVRKSVSVAFGENTVLWYSGSDDVNYSASWQLNYAGTTYHYIAIG